MESLPDLTTPAPQPEAAALTATGTDGRILAPLGHRAGDGTCPVLSATVASDDLTTVSQAACRWITTPWNHRELSEPVGSCRPLTTERGGFEPPIRSYPYNGLANRRAAAASIKSTKPLRLATLPVARLGTAQPQICPLT